MIPIFSYMQKIGNIPEQDMYRTQYGNWFNTHCFKRRKEKVESILTNYPKNLKIFEIGKIISGQKSNFSAIG